MAIHKESSFYGGIAPDPFLGSEGTFQYSRNLDIRSELNGVQLLPAPQSRSVSDLLMCYVKFNKDHLIRIYASGQVRTGNNSPFTDSALCNVGFGPLGATKFRDHVYVFGFSSIKRFDLSGTVTDITPPDWTILAPSRLSGSIPVINYRNSALLVGFGNKLRRGLPSVIDGPIEIGGRKMVRTFDKAEIRGIIGRSMNIEVYVDYNEIDSRLYYIGGFWDAEDTGISDTVVFENLSFLQIGQLGSRVFVVCRDKTDSRTTYLYEVSGYNKRLIRKSKEDGGNNAYFDDFNVGAMYQYAPTWGDVIFLPFKDGLWSYGRFNDYTPDALVRMREGRQFWTGVCFSTWMYCSYIDNGNFREIRYPLRRRYNDFTPSTGVLIGRIVTGNIRTIKELKRAWVSYKIDTTDVPVGETPGYLRLYLRFDRSAFNTEDGWIHIEDITDASKMSERIDTLQIGEAGIPRCNVFERKIEIVPGTYRGVSPIFYDIEFEYDDIQE